jgi:hypothetical protein
MLAEGQQPRASCSSEPKSLGVSASRWRIEKQSSMSLSQEAWIGRWMRCAFSQTVLRAIRGLADVRAARVDDPDDASGRRLGLGGHDLLDERPNGSIPGLRFTVVEETSTPTSPALTPPRWSSQQLSALGPTERGAGARA